MSVNLTEYVVAENDLHFFSFSTFIFLIVLHSLCFMQTRAFSLLWCITRCCCKWTCHHSNVIWHRL